MGTLDNDSMNAELVDFEYIPAGVILTNRSSMWEHETDR
jgi:hypothetical protein